MKVQISADTLAEIGRQCREAYPRECVGLLLGQGDDDRREVLEAQPLQNSSESSEQNHRYLIDPFVMMEADKRADQRGLLVVGVYHSHPDHPALPSEYDRVHAWPWLVYTITSVEAGDPKETRAWLLDQDREQFEEVELSVGEMHEEKKG